MPSCNGSQSGTCPREPRTGCPEVSASQSASQTGVCAAGRQATRLCGPPPRRPAACCCSPSTLGPGPAAGAVERETWPVIDTRWVCHSSITVAICPRAALRYEHHAGRRQLDSRWGDLIVAGHHAPCLPRRTYSVSCASASIVSAPPVLATHLIRPDHDASRRLAVVDVKPAKHAPDRDRPGRVHVDRGAGRHELPDPWCGRLPLK